MFGAFRTVKVVEERRGTRGGHYVYVVEGNELIHISEYAIRIFSGKYRDRVVYEVSVEKVRGEIVYCFSFSRSGSAFLGKCRIEDFQNGLPRKYEFYEPLRDKFHELRGLRFRIKDPILKELVSEFYQVFVPMIKEIKDYGRRMGIEYSFMGYAKRAEEVLEDPDLYYFAFMSLPSDVSRRRSLKNTRKWIYELWMLKTVCECLQVSKFTYPLYKGKPYWWIEQGSDISTCIGETPLGDLTFWLEFQPSKRAHMVGMLVRRRVTIRPDIVIAKGHFEKTADFVNSGKAIDVLIECKEDPFDEWKGEIGSQILQYKEIFKPRIFIVASLRSVPISVKRYLQSLGIEVVDNLRPGKGSIGTLCNLLCR